MAGGSAALTLVILAGFAVVVGILTAGQVRGQFNNDVRTASEQLQSRLNGQLRYDKGLLEGCDQNISLTDFASAEHAQIRIFDRDGLLVCTQRQVKLRGGKAPVVTSLFSAPPLGPFTEDGFRGFASRLAMTPRGSATLVYARPLSDIDRTLARVRFFLLLGVIGGTVLALGSGLAIAQRAMRPITELTDAAREIERTRDPSRRVPHPKADDEVAELARTLEGMLGALDSSRGETEAMLERQREFVADASHELRTPLTSVLANLELLAEELEGEQAETAQAALRSTKRMRRLVGDLLLLARADAKRKQPLRPTDLSDVLTDVAAELGPVADDHELSIDATPAVVPAIRDDVHRLILNLLENAVEHTPPGTSVRACTYTENGDGVVVVEDDGPGIPADLRRRVFERFVRGGREGSRGSGLGLAIVRAVVDSHHGSVALEPPSAGSGSRFVIRIPTAESGRPDRQTSTTTGSTIGRRRSRS